MLLAKCVVSVVIYVRSKCGYLRTSTYLKKAFLGPNVDILVVKQLAVRAVYSPKVGYVYTYLLSNKHHLSNY